MTQKLKEEKDLQTITEEFEAALQQMRKKNYKKAADGFAAIVETYKDSEFYSVLEVQARAKVYLKIPQERLNPTKLEYTDNEEYLKSGIFQLNSRETASALELFKHLEKQNNKDAYVLYLTALAYLQKEETEHALDYLKRAISIDNKYKLLAYNEPDFEPLQQDEEFIALVG